MRLLPEPLLRQASDLRAIFACALAEGKSGACPARFLPAQWAQSLDTRARGRSGI